ncbi:hypothetical protein BDR26DRAFT_872374 [Obelidium mucronatum]|nr:hypothetical protein BDR26DRAFT_872374 [Obelidium mucronatum]
MILLNTLKPISTLLLMVANCAQPNSSCLRSLCNTKQHRIVPIRPIQLGRVWQMVRRRRRLFHLNTLPPEQYHIQITRHQHRHHHLQALVQGDQLMDLHRVIILDHHLIIHIHKQQPPLILHKDRTHIRRHHHHDTKLHPPAVLSNLNHTAHSITHRLTARIQLHLNRTHPKRQTIVQATTPRTMPTIFGHLNHNHNHNHKLTLLPRRPIIPKSKSISSLQLILILLLLRVHDPILGTQRASRL